ncbi:MAG TPA: SulP family inorganic anion transporter, partial [Deltaproteobacteria bacterium]|nr:SulP family inorganic anion transporter [Deltaproteobacteria bacterium]
SLQTVADVSPVPAGLPPLALPSLEGIATLFPVAVAAMVLSLVESSAVSRTLASRSGQRIDVGADFVGLGAANVAAALSGGYPVSGSLSRSGLNFSLGARTRLSGVLSGLMVLLVPLSIGPLIDYTPIAALAGTIVIVAIDLIDHETIGSLLRAGSGDRLAFLGTVLGTWFLPLEQAIYLGISISIVLFLRRVRLLVIRELWVDRDLRLQEVSDDQPPPGAQRCRAIRVLHVEGPLFFGAASELEGAISELRADPHVQVIIIRLKRAQGVDYTTGAVLSRARSAMEESGRHLMLVGMRADMMQRLKEIGVTDSFSDEVLFPTEPGWFVAMNQALARAMELVRQEDCPDHPCEGCPLARYVEHHRRVPRIDH